MKIEKYLSYQIKFDVRKGVHQIISFDTQEDRDAVFEKWESSLKELKASKAIFRPVYEDSNGEIRILKLRYSTPQEAINIEQKRFEHFGEGMKLIAIYNEAEHTFSVIHQNEIF